MDNNRGKIIRNVATLDLRSAKAESLAGIRRIDNVATIIYSAETAELVGTLSIGNVASMVKLPEGVRVVTGQEEISRDTFKEVDTPLDLFVVGQVFIKPDIPVEELRAGLNSLYVTGQLFYPESLAGAVKSKLSEVNGQTMAYSDDAKLIMGKLVLTESYLRGLADKSTLLIIGRLDATTVLPNELIAQKIEKIDFMGRVTCCEENAETLIARIKNAPHLTTIPTGYLYLNQPLVVDATMLGSLPGKKLYGTTVRIEPDVTAAALTEALDGLILTDLLIAPAPLRTALSKICNLLETTAIFYEGELWLIEGESTLHTSRFEYLDGKATLVVRGELTIGEDVDAPLLAQHFAKVHNFGEIHCTPAQMSALQARLGTNKGEFIHERTVADEDENVIGNAAYLVL